MSAATDSEVTTSDILMVSDYSIESVFRKFYNQPTDNPLCGRAM